ncbi:MAG: neuromedin U, partial [Thiogranum sp.]
WSFAGDSDRADVNQLLLRGLIRRELRNRWFFISAPIITANWNAASGQKWRVPLGGGFGRALSRDRAPVNVSLQLYWNVIRPDGAPDWLARVGVTFPFQLPQ